jgi:hypothetical protein
MEYFGSTVLFAVVSYFLLVLFDSPQIIDPSLFSCMTTSAIPILTTSPFVVLLEAVDMYPLPDWSVFVAERTGNLVGLVAGDRIEGYSIGLVWDVRPCQKRMNGCPQAG